MLSSLIVVSAAAMVTSASMLYPLDTSTRETKSLDGLWNFKLGDTMDPDRGFDDEWYSRPLAKSGGPVSVMPVPASYNDIPVEKSGIHRCTYND